MTLRHPLFWKLLAWSLLATVAFLTLTPNPPKVDMAFLSWDKAQHFFAYMLLMWVFAMAWEGRRVAAWAIFLVCVGVSLEWLQGLMGIRVMEIWDMLANSIGVGLGWAISRTTFCRTLVWIESRLARL
jgi:VanZ family protein